MPKSRILVVETLRSLIVFILFYTVFVSAVYAFNGSGAILWQALLLLAPAALNFALRRLCRTFWEQLIAHAVLPVVLAVVLPFEALTVMWIAAVAIMALFSVAFSLRPPSAESAGFIFPVIGLFILLTFWAASGDHSLLTAVYPVALILVISGRMLLTRMIKMDRSLEIMHQTYKQPVDRIITFDYKLTAGVAVVLVAMVAVIYLLVLSPIIGAIMGLSPEVGEFDMPTAPYVPLSLPEGGGDGLDPMAAFRQENGSWAIWEFLTRVLFGIGGIGLVVLAVYVAYRVLMFFLGLRIHKKAASPMGVSAEDQREFIWRAPKIRGQKRRVASNLHPIRKLFKDTAKKHVKMGVPIKKSDTPTEMKDRIRVEDIGELVETYEEVRYK